ncbi:MAG: DUF421 domain-containing protein, partial [Armatimonadetes bacterium 13_1_40CM_3_65_7]
MLRNNTPLWEIALRTTSVYVAILVGLRLLGKRQLGQMTIADLVMILLIANAVQNAMVGPDVSLIGGLIAAAVLLVVNFVFVQLLASSRLAQRLMEGHPTMLVKDGAFVTSGIRREGLDTQEVESAIREHGIVDVSGVRIAYLEPDGTISVIPIAVEP